MQRVKNVDYDQDELYDDEDYDQEPEESYTAQDREQFASLTPVVRAELEEAGLQASDRDIEAALWDSYWEVEAAVTTLKKKKAPKQQQTPKKEKAKSKFDLAAERTAKETGEFRVFFVHPCNAVSREKQWYSKERRGGSCFSMSLK